MVRLMLAHLLLYSGMSLSKTTWSLYLDQKHALPLLAVTYTAMAVTGVAGAAVTGWLVDRVGVAGVISVGSVIYAAGLLLRLQHTSWLLAVVNGVVMGIGASVLTTCLRPWLVQITDDDTRPRAVSYRTATTDIGIALGSALLTPLLLFTPDTHTGYVAGLVLPALIIGAIAVLRPRHLLKPRNTDTSGTGPSAVPKPMAMGVLALGLLSGFGLSMLVPYAPLILNRADITPSLVGLSMSGLAVIRVLVAVIAGHFDRKRHRLTGLVAAELSIAAACLSTALLRIPLATVLLLTLVYAGLAVAAYSEELIQADLFPEHLRGRLFGLSSSGFLAGDALGGLTGALILAHTDVTGLLVTCAAAALLTACAYPLFVNRMRAQAAAGKGRAPER
ncbi:MFS transporter [Amycolatopsis sp. CA-230715]|uniref:MFS transporter n=1 Tax=Amycolatopsis sp. CA-230715 TaxID=2745196 RepID=UPI001C02F007|nr:MFS transporter [Amycolatopsis sp. CA-230715]